MHIQRIRGKITFKLTRGFTPIIVQIFDQYQFRIAFYINKYNKLIYLK